MSDPAHEVRRDGERQRGHALVRSLRRAGRLAPPGRRVPARTAGRPAISGRRWRGSARAASGPARPRPSGALLADFRDACLGIASAPLKLADGLAATELAQAGYRSLAEAPPGRAATGRRRPQPPHLPRGAGAASAMTTTVDATDRTSTSPVAPTIAESSTGARWPARSAPSSTTSARLHGVTMRQIARRLERELGGLERLGGAHQLAEMVGIARGQRRRLRGHRPPEPHRRRRRRPRSRVARRHVSPGVLGHRAPRPRARRRLRQER